MTRRGTWFRLLRRGFLRLGLLFGVVPALAGCEQPTGYQAATASYDVPGEVFAYGYRVRDLGSGDYSVVVRATPVTPAPQAEDVALLRAAHLTREKGGAQFAVLHSQFLSVPRTRITRTMQSISGSSASVFSESESPVFVDKIAVLVVHVLGAGEGFAKPALDAQEIVDRLGPVLEQR